MTEWNLPSGFNLPPGVSERDVDRDYEQSELYGRDDARDLDRLRKLDSDRDAERDERLEKGE